MTVWLVRAGRRGKQEQAALDNNVVTIAWNELPDLSGINTKETLTDLYRETHPDDSPQSVGINVGQVWTFRQRMEAGDLAVLPLHIQSAIATGKIAGPYQYRTDLGDEVHHVRPVKWLPSPLQAELPLKRIGALVLEE